MSPTSSMYDYTNNTAMSGRKSSHEAEIGRHGISCYTKSRASMAGIGSVEATGASRGRISSGLEHTITRVTGGRISFGNGRFHGSPYTS